MARTNGFKHEDIGNILMMEHVNVTIPDQSLATSFYIVGMGFTRDPYMMVGLNNIWVNIGHNQCHLPTREAQVLRGHIGIVVPDLDALVDRLKGVKDQLAKTKFGWSVENAHVDVTCPWGNRFRAHAPSPQFGSMTLGIPYVEFEVERGTAKGIGKFYEKAFGAPSLIEKESSGMTAHVQSGVNQELIFRETKGPLPPYDGHHIAIYVGNFSGPYSYLDKRDKITEGVRNHQFRFQDIVDPDTGDSLFTIEHEVRGALHPLFHRPLVNRDAQAPMLIVPRNP